MAARSRFLRNKMTICVCEMSGRKGACGKCTRPWWLDIEEEEDIILPKDCGIIRREVKVNIAPVVQ